jgi:hypothetical protein
MATYQICYVGAITAPTFALLNLESDLKKAIEEAKRGAKFLDPHYWRVDIYDINPPQTRVWTGTWVHDTKWNEEESDYEAN